MPTGIYQSKNRKGGVKGKSGIYKRTKPGWNKGKHWSMEIKEKMSKAHKGIQAGVNNPFYGKKHTIETRKKLSESHKGEKSFLWKGGISFYPYPINWNNTLKRAIRERDNYICQLCSQYGNYIHHIDYNKLNCNPTNLITLCQKCHSKTNGNRNFWIKYFNQYGR